MLIVPVFISLVIYINGIVTYQYHTSPLINNSASQALFKDPYTTEKTAENQTNNVNIQPTVLIFNLQC